MKRERGRAGARELEEAAVTSGASCRCRDPRGDAGFALIMAILALMLLTFLGLTMAATTSTELQIATNQRWSEQARYNAEAGIEAGKTLLRDMTWSAVLPVPRPQLWLPGDTVGAPTPNGPARGTRNFELAACDYRAGQEGYGVVLDDGGAGAPYEYKSTILGVPLNGNVTIWIRRMLKVDANAKYTDDPSNDKLVLVAEGTAPHTGAPTTFARSRDAVRVLETFLDRSPPSGTPCGTRGGQTSQGPEGAGFGCAPVTGESVGKVLGLGSVGETTAR